MLNGLDGGTFIEDTKITIASYLRLDNNLC